MRQVIESQWLLPTLLPRSSAALAALSSPGFARHRLYYPIFLSIIGPCCICRSASGCEVVENRPRNPAKTDRNLSAAGKFWRNLFAPWSHASNFPRKFSNAILVRSLLKVSCVNCHEAADDKLECRSKLELAGENLVSGAVECHQSQGAGASAQADGRLLATADSYGPVGI